MSGQSDLVLLDDGIAKLEEEFAQVPVGEDRTEIEALLDLARETYTMVKARLEKRPKQPASVSTICSDIDRPRLHCKFAVANGSKSARTLRILQRYPDPLVTFRHQPRRRRA